MKEKRSKSARTLTQEEDVCDKREEHQFRLLGIKINLSHIHTLGILREDTDLSLSVCVQAMQSAHLTVSGGGDHGKTAHAQSVFLPS
jgi:REP element-mobilizing transposase RayT